MKLLKLILENKEFRGTLESELNKNFREYRPLLSMSEYSRYSRDRSDNDPLKNKGFGDVTFKYNGDLPDELFDNAVRIIEKLGGEITGKRNQYEAERGERPYYPRIKFNYSL